MTDLNALRLTYRNAVDSPGAGNCSIALALAAAARGEDSASEHLLSQSWEDHRQGQATGEPLATGMMIAAAGNRAGRMRCPAGEDDREHSALETCRTACPLRSSPR